MTDNAGRAVFTAAPSAVHAVRASAANWLEEVRPQWLRQLLVAAHEQLPAALQDDWAREARYVLRTRPPAAGLRVVHAWQTRTVLPLLATAWARKPSPELDRLDALHRTAAVTRITPDTWRSGLTPVLRRLYRSSYDYPAACAVARAGAAAWALANGHTPEQADEYGRRYAELSATANAEAFAEAHARALGGLLAHAYATDHDDGYAATYPGAQLRAVVAASGPGTQAAGDSPGACGPAPVPAILADGLLAVLREG
ncbi:hypothetical protein [Streptomyces sp. NBC_01176]|uniref:hypothetical protein n=1 Tax=Streptomyces sp. NBC_01176 TaxID=2903760 RepID=UPI002F910EE7|nr:hypothetical protein OG199_44810 [Streptomyces sp. NBC_01176]